MTEWTRCDWTIVSPLIHRHGGGSTAWSTNLGASVSAGPSKTIAHVAPEPGPSVVIRHVAPGV